MIKIRKLWFCVFIFIIVGFFGVYRWNVYLEEQRYNKIRDVIYKSKEIVIKEIDSEKCYYTENNMFDILARWDEDERISEPDNVVWKYHFWFKMGSNIVEVYVADESYYMINEECYKLNSDVTGTELYDDLRILVPLSIKGYDCSTSYWCTSLCRNEE